MARVLGGLALLELGSLRGWSWWPPRLFCEACVTKIPVLATLHYLDLLKDCTMMGCTVGDWRKVPRILTGEWPRQLPPVRLYTPALLAERATHDEWWDKAHCAPYLYLDTEYVDKRPIHTRLLRLIGLWYPGASYAIQCRWMQSGDPSWVRAMFRERLHQCV